MQVVREVVNSNVLMNIFNLPLDLRNRRVEVLILPADEQPISKMLFRPQDYAGALKLTDAGAEILKMRAEWERC